MLFADLEPVLITRANAKRSRQARKKWRYANEPSFRSKKIAQIRRRQQEVRAAVLHKYGGSGSSASEGVVGEEEQVTTALVPYRCQYGAVYSLPAGTVAAFPSACLDGVFLDMRSCWASGLVDPFTVRTFRRDGDPSCPDPFLRHDTVGWKARSL